jgi:ribokinase
MIGCVGADADGTGYRQRLKREGIRTTGISVTRKAPTGIALISVDRRGENTIVVAAGANGELDPDAVRAQSKLIRAAQALLVQFEIPMPAVIETVRIANSAGVPVTLNPSPLHRGFPWGRLPLDTVIANWHEAESIFGREQRRWRRAVAQRGIGQLIVTRGARPTLCVNADGSFETRTIAVKPVDTVGAGDTFAGVFVARRAEGDGLAKAIAYANSAAALATLKPGAQEAMPNRKATQKAAYGA